VRPRTALAVLCAASFLAVVDTTIVSTRCRRSDGPGVHVQRVPVGGFAACLIFVISALVLSRRSVPSTISQHGYSHARFERKAGP
jgi:hypothetical protein